MRALTVGWLVVAATAGCSPPEGRFACSVDDACPLGWSCLDGYCYGHRFDVGSGLDAPFDVGSRDGGSLDANVDASDAPFDGMSFDAGNLPDVCEASATNPLNCGSCGNVCTAPLNAEGTCAASVCGFACTAPHLLVPGATADYCSQFGGLYVTNSSGLCARPNALTGMCTCPTDFSDQSLGEWSVTAGAGSLLHVCLAPTPSVVAGWGGVYLLNETAGRCVFPNQLSGGADCSCPAGFTDEASLVGLTAGEQRLRLGVCRMGAMGAAGGTLEHAYTVVRGGGGPCVPETCLTTGGCSCPPGTDAATIMGVARLPSVTVVCSADAVYCIPG